MSSRRKFLRNAAAAAIAPLLPLPALAAVTAPKPSELPYIPIDQIPNHRALMRQIVIGLSDYCRRRQPGFVVLARNAPELLVKETHEVEWERARDPDGASMGRYSAAGSLDAPYLNAIDGMLIDGLSYGHEVYERATQPGDQALLANAAAMLHHEGRRGFGIEYCKDAKHRAEAATRAAKANLLTYFDGEGDRSLSHIPAGAPSGENSNHITDLTGVKTYLPLLSSAGFARRERWLDALAGTNYDLLIIDPFWRGQSMTVQDVRALKFKRLGSERLVFATLPVGYAAVDRFYWQAGWQVGSPDFLEAVDPDETSHFITNYWADSWKKVLGNYVTGLCDLGIDGVLLDGLESYLYFEAMQPF